MAEIDPSRLIPIVTGVQLKAELGDRPLAYRIEQEARRLLLDILGKPPEGELPRLTPVVLSDVYYLNTEALQERPTIAIGGPGMNLVSANWVEQLPTAVAIEETLVIQMDLDMHDVRCAVWGMDHLSTVRAADLFILKGYLEVFVRGAARGSGTGQAKPESPGQ